MGATQSRPRETRGGGGEEEIAVAVAVVVGLGVAVAAVRLGVAAWNAMRSLASSLQHHQKRTFEFKVNGSVGEDQKGGSGGVLRNEKGEFLCGFYEHLGEEADLTAAEVRPIKGALEVFSNNKFKWDGQYDELIVANDNDSSVRLANGEQDKPKYRPLVEEINRLKSAIGKVRFNEIREEDNREALALARRGRMHSGPRVVSYEQSFKGFGLS